MQFRKIIALLFACLISTATANTAQRADFVRVSKSESRLYLLSQGEIFASYHVVFGRGGNAPKQREGDGLTPEGRYVLDSKNDHSGFYKAIHISYPSPEDRMRAARLGVSPGGSVMIHGQKNGFAWLAPLVQHFDWTNGCVALTNEEMDAVWNSVDVGTPIEIKR